MLINSFLFPNIYNTMLYLKDIIDVNESIENGDTIKEVVVIKWKEEPEEFEITWAKYNEETGKVEIYIDN